MCKQKAVWIVSLIFTIAASCFAEYSIIKPPIFTDIGDYACTDDYIWYVGSYYHGMFSGIGRLHVPSQKGKFFTADELGRSPSRFSCKLVVVDSSYAAFLLGDTVYYCDGTYWNYSTYSEVYKDLLATPSTGKLWMLSSYSIVIMDKNGITDTIPKDSIGLSDPLISFAKDNSENIWVISNNQIARYDNRSWKVMVQDGSMNFSKVDITLDGKICFLSDGRYYTLVDGHLDTLPLSVHLRNSNSNVDERGNQWNQLDSAMNVSLQMITVDKKNVTFHNAKASGWKNWPEFIGLTSDSAIRIWKKDVYFKYFNGFYHYGGDTNNLYWEWLPVNTSFSLFEASRVDKLLPSHDSSIYLMRVPASHAYINEVLKLKSNQFQSLPPIKFTNSAGGFYEDHNGTLWAAGEGLYKLENSVWTRVTIPGIMSFGKIEADNLGRILLFEKVQILTSDGQVHIRSILRQSGSDWEIINETNANLPSDCSRFVQDSKGTYWVGAYRGLFKSKDLYQWTMVDSAESLFPSNYITDLIVNSKGNVIVAVQSYKKSDAGIAVVQFDGTRWESLGMPFDSITSGKLCEDKEGRLWCGSVGYRPILSYYDSKGWHKAEELPIYELKSDSSNQLWFRLSDASLSDISGLSGLLCKYTPENENPVVNKIYKDTNSRPININSTGVGNVKIMYTVTNPSDIRFEIFDLQGKSVQIIRKGFHNKGSYQLHWNNKNAKGVYLIRMITHNSAFATRFEVF